MNMKKTIKRVVALTTGATMLGATVLGAMAADLSEYPSPMFIKDGKFDGLIVIGADGDTQDMLGAMDVISSLQAVAVSGATGTAAVTETVGDVYQFAKTSDKMNLGEMFSTIRTKLSDTQLPIVLADGSLSLATGSSYDYEQEVDINKSTSTKLQFFADKDYEDEKPVVGIKIPRNQVVMNYSLTFTKTAKSTLTSDAMVDFEDRQIEILGETFDIIGSDGSDIRLDLMRGALKPTLEEGETATYTIDGKEYEVTALIITDSSTAPAVKFKVNGEVTDSMVTGNIYELADGVLMGVREILPNEAGDVTQDMVEFYLGAKKIVLQHGQELEIDNEDVSNLDVHVVNTSASGTQFQLEKIGLQWNAEDDLFITEDGNSVSMPGLESVKFYMDGFYKGQEEQIEIGPSGDDTVVISAPLKDYDVTLDILYDANNDGAFNFTGGSATKQLITQTCTDSFTVDMDTDEYFVVTKINGKEAETAVLELTKVHDTDGVTVKDYSGQVVAENKKENKTFDIADMEVLISNISQSASNASFQITDSSCVEGMLVTAEGLKIQLPYINITQLNTTTNVSGSLPVAAANTTSCAYANEGILDGEVRIVTMVNSTDTGTACYASSFGFIVTEEDRDENIGSGVGYKLNATFNSDNEAHVTLVAKTNLSNAKTYSVDDTKVYVGYVESEVSSKITEDKVSDQYNIEITYPGEETYADVYVGSKASQVTTMAGSEGSVAGKIEVGAAVLDTSLASYTTQNIIVVGGPAINRATAALMGKTYPSYGAESGIQENAGLIKLVEQADGTVAVIVAGWEADDTQRAGIVLANSADYALSGDEVVITGTSMTDISVGVPAVEEEVVA